MKFVFRIFALAAGVALAGCSGSNYCKGEQPYQKAQSVPPLKAADGLKLPESASALKIPPPAVNPVPYGEAIKDADGDDAVRCLDKPPEMAAVVAPAAPPAAPPVAAPVKVETPPEAVPEEAPKPAQVMTKKKAKAKPNKVLSPADPAAPPPEPAK